MFIYIHNVNYLTDIQNSIFKSPYTQLDYSFYETVCIKIKIFIEKNVCPIFFI